MDARTPSEHRGFAAGAPTADRVPPDLRLALAINPDDQMDLADADDRRLWSATLELMTSGRHDARLILSILLSATRWDAAFREHEIFDGSVYFASTAAVRALIEITTTHAGTSPGEVDAILQLLFDLELAYRFPVALKFRGKFAEEKQVRLNCWGRRLADRLRDSGKFDAEWDHTATLTRAHLIDHERRYRAHMDRLRAGAFEPLGSAWDSAQTLPVGTLC